MAVGGVKRGGRAGGTSGTGGVKGSSGTGKSFGVSGASEAGKAESLVGKSRASDPVTVSLQGIAQELANGTIGSKSEATQKAVHTILQQKGLLGKNGKGNKKLVEQIADTLQDDPRLAAALERTWSRAGNK